MALTTEQREALPDSDFAVPELRVIPIHDKTHVTMAWAIVDNTKGLTGQQRFDARKRIMARATELGVNTTKWSQPMFFSAMALKFPKDTEEHPNKLPFTGILTRLDQPSTRPLQGTGGKRVLLTKQVAKAALASLLGMAVDFTPDFDGHAPKRKIGLITAADIVSDDLGDAIEISGFFYAADFPEEVQFIQAEKEKLGFSFEAQSLIQSMKTDPLVVVACDFTGAAVLYKDKAAYQDTSLAAQAEQEIEMTKEELQALQTSVTATATSLADLTKNIPGMIAEAVKAALPTGVSAQAASILPMVTTHCGALRQCAEAMKKAGIGMAGNMGHVNILMRMADEMEAEAAAGRLPATFYAGAALAAGTQAQQPDQAAIIKAATDAVTTAVEAKLKPMADSVASLTTTVTDLKTKIAASGGADRKTLAPAHVALLQKMGLTAGGDDKLTVAQVDEAARKANIAGEQSIALKLALKEKGLLS